MLLQQHLSKYLTFSTPRSTRQVHRGRMTDLLHQWRAAAAHRADARALLRHAVMRMTHAKLAAALAGWREAAAHRKAKREMLQVRSVQCLVGIGRAAVWFAATCFSVASHRPADGILLTPL